MDMGFPFALVLIVLITCISVLIGVWMDFHYNKDKEGK